MDDDLDSYILSPVDNKKPEDLQSELYQHCSNYDVVPIVIS